MKKAIISALVLVLLLTGCATNENPGTQNEQTLKDQTTSEKNKELTRGIWEDNTYTSEFSGLKFEMPDGWLYASDEEMAEIMSIGADVMSDAGLEFSDEMLKLQTIYDMMASDTITGTNVIVMYENLGMVIGGSKYTEKQYLEILLAQLDATEMGYVYGDISETQLGGLTYSVVEAEVEMNGITATQLYFVRRVDKYMLAIIVSVMDSDDAVVEQVISGFSN